MNPLGGLINAWGPRAFEHCIGKLPRGIDKGWGQPRGQPLFPSAARHAQHLLRWAFAIGGPESL